MPLRPFRVGITQSNMSMRAGHLQHLVHLLRGLPDREAADGVAAAVRVVQAQRVLHRLLTQVRIHAALDDGEHRLPIAVQGLRLVKMRGEALQPALREAQRLRGVADVRVAGAALVQGHDDVRADDALGVHVVLRGKGMAGAVDMRGEPASFLGKLADGREGEDLEAAAVRQDGPVPVLELVQAAGLPEGVQAGTEVEVVGVAEDDLGLDVLFQVPMIHALDGADGAHRHGGADLPVVGGDHARAGGGPGIPGCELEREHQISFKRSKLRIFSYFCVIVNLNR